MTNDVENNESESKSPSINESINDHPVERSSNSNISTVKSNLPQSSSNNSMNMKSKQPLFNDQEKENKQFKYRTKYPSFLPSDFTVDETDGVHELPTGFLNTQELHYLKTIAYKLNRNPLMPTMKLTDEEARFIR